MDNLLRIAIRCWDKMIAVYGVAIDGAWPGFVDGCEVGSAIGVVKAVANGAD